MTALVIAEHENGALHPATARAVAAAKQCAPGVEILVAGAGQAAAQSAAALGVTRAACGRAGICGVSGGKHRAVDRARGGALFA